MSATDDRYGEFSFQCPECCGPKDTPATWTFCHRCSDAKATTPNPLFGIIDERDAAVAERDRIAARCDAAEELVMSLRNDIEALTARPDCSAPLLGLMRERDKAREAYGEAIAGRDAWIRFFNRLEAAITHHRRDSGFADANDESLWAARDRVLREAADELFPTEGQEA
jgi:hypothetical protein